MGATSSLMLQFLCCFCSTKPDSSRGRDGSVTNRYFLCPNDSDVFSEGRGWSVPAPTHHWAQRQQPAWHSCYQPELTLHTLSSPRLAIHGSPDVDNLGHVSKWPS